MIERDGAGAPWRFSDQPLLGVDRDRAAAVRDGGAVRAVVSVVPQLAYPPADDLPEPDPNVPPPIVAAVRAARRRLPAARDRERLARRAAHRVRRLAATTAR